MQFSRRDIFFVLIAAVLAGCGSSGKVAAMVNGQIITVKDVDDRLGHLNPSTRAALGGDRARVLDQMVLEELLTQEARRRGLENDAEVRQLLKEAKRQVLFGRLLEVMRQERTVSISDEAVSKYYGENKERFVQPETFRASHILVADETTAKKALERIKGGEAFAQVAQELSTDPSRARGGDIGYFAKGQVIPEFEEACRKLSPNEMSGVVKSPLGYHVILLAEKRPSRQKPFEEVKAQIQQALESQDRQRQIESFIQGLRSKAQVRIVDKTLSPASPPAESAPAAAPSQPSGS